MKNTAVVIFLFLSFSHIYAGDRFVMVIRDQSEFDRIQQKIVSLINTKETDIYIDIAPGSYVSRENHFTLSNINAPNTKLHIVSKGAIIFPQGKDYHNGDEYEGVFSPENSWLSGNKDISIWSKVRFSDGLIEVVDEKDKLCRLKSKELLEDGLDVSNSYILLTHWYRSSVYKVMKIEKGYIYFTATNLKPGYKNGYNVNDDYNFARLNPRYKLCNVEIGEDYMRIVNGKVVLPSGVQVIREGHTDRIITFNKCKLASIVISGFSFYGNGNGHKLAAINISNTESNIFRICNCHFFGFKSDVVNITTSSNITIDNNTFFDCYLNGIRSGNGSSTTIVKGNTFSSMGKQMDNTFCVVCRGESFYITNNLFTDFGYGGIGAGVWYKNVMANNCNGLISGNELNYSKGYMDDIANYTTMDSGAIYLWTKSNGIEIRNNYIHDIVGMRSNQGIFCDDGAYNFKIIGNVVTRIINSNCIGSRRVSKLEIFDTSGIVRSNMNNIIKDNIVDGMIQFVGNERDNNGCFLGDIFLLLDKDGRVPEHSIKNVTQTGNIINVLYYSGQHQERFGFSQEDFRRLENNPEWGNVKRWFIRKTNNDTSKHST